jgi:hypothetical protein
MRSRGIARATTARAAGGDVMSHRRPDRPARSAGSRRCRRWADRNKIRRSRRSCRHRARPPRRPRLQSLPAERRLPSPRCPPSHRWRSSPSRRFRLVMRAACRWSHRPVERAPRRPPAPRGRRARSLRSASRSIPPSSPASGALATTKRLRRDTSWALVSSPANSPIKFAVQPAEVARLNLDSVGAHTVWSKQFAQIKGR